MLQPSQDEADVVSGAGEVGIDAVSVLALKWRTFRSNRPSAFNWPITSSMGPRRLRRLRMVDVGIFYPDLQTMKRSMPWPR
jgi:hypothetical protein